MNIFCKISACLFFVFATKTANTQIYTLARYADESGLPVRIITQSVQDKNGFLWSASFNGLFKFDGQEFSTYRSNLRDTSGLRNNRINSVIETSDGRIWLGTPAGLHYLENDSIHYFSLPSVFPENAAKEDESNYILNLFEDSIGNLWAGTYEGVFVIEKDRTEIHHINETKEGIYNFKGKTIWAVSQGFGNRIWVCTNTGINFFTGKEPLTFNRFGRVELPDFPERNVTPFDIIQLDSTQILAATNKGILHGVFSGDSLLTLRKFRDENGEQIAPFFIYDMEADTRGNIWVGTFRNKFKKYRFENGELIEQSLNIVGGADAVGSKVSDILIDRQENIWISSVNGLFKLSNYDAPIYKFPPEHLPDCLKDFSDVAALVDDTRGFIWLSTPQGLYRFPKTDIFNRICPENYLHFSDENFKSANRMMIDSSNRLWIGTLAGLTIVQLDESSQPTDIQLFTKEAGLPHNWVFGFAEIAADTFFVTNYIRLIKMIFPDGDMNKTKFKFYNSDEKRSDALVNSYTQEVVKDLKTGSIWTGTFHGLSKVISDEYFGQFENYLTQFGDPTSLSNNSVKNLLSDSKGNLWIGTQTGLNLYSDSLNRFFRYGSADGLPSEYILGIAEDKEGFIWISTTNGVSRFQFDTSDLQLKNFKYYSPKDGLSDNISNRNAILIDSENRIFIGNSKGLNIIENKEDEVEKPLFNLQLTDFKISGDSAEVDVSYHRNFMEAELTHTQNSFSLKYVSLNFINPEQNVYRYKINDGNWIETGTDSELDFYKLSSGYYRVLLDGSDNRGNWHPEPIHLSIRICPPIWKSKPAFILYFIAIGLLLRFLYKNRLKRRLKKIEARLNMEKALIREREQLRRENAADFHDELGNKITKISLYLELADRSVRSGKNPIDWLKKIRKNTEQLSGGFRDLLWVIDPKKDSLLDSFMRLKEFGEDLFENSKTDFEAKDFRQISETVQLNAETKKQVLMIFKEAMNNSLKYSGAKQCIFRFCSAVDETGDTFSLIFSDNGKGMVREKSEKGRGLKNMKMRAEKIGAELRIESSLNIGTKVTLSKIPHLTDAKRNFDI